jgi:hypothetical protein
MEDQQLGRLLRELPRERAGDHFTAHVLNSLAGLDGKPERRTRQARPTQWAVATAALLALLVSAALIERRDLWRSGHNAEARQALEEIRDEHERLARELERLQSLRAGHEAEPEVIYLGGNESFDLVLDPDSMPEGATLPASYEPETF